jgi:hypothetical protein
MFKIRYTPEELSDMKAYELDQLVERLVIGSRPEPGVVHRIRKSWARVYRRLHPADLCAPRTVGRQGVHGFGDDTELPEYSSNYEGMGMIIEKMQRKGYTLTIEPNDKVRFVKDGKETEYSLMVWDMDLPRTVAIAAVLAVQ